MSRKGSHCGLRYDVEEGQSLELTVRCRGRAVTAAYGTMSRKGSLWSLRYDYEEGQSLRLTVRCRGRAVTAAYGTMSRKGSHCGLRYDVEEGQSLRLTVRCRGRAVSGAYGTILRKGSHCGLRYDVEEGQRSDEREADDDQYRADGGHHLGPHVVVAQPAPGGRAHGVHGAVDDEHEAQYDRLQIKLPAENSNSRRSAGEAPKVGPNCPRATHTAQ